ncbi:general secretion pathway protein GspB [Tahibacter sp.]|uniref:general secretion pathway protein GspB n=1 Tax=Tahibacter sp. TaxID=2056211 RepID=UPI0028C3DB17|nr:general secretion pathway protein GspB [Tahibacter sp.]
MSLIHEALKKAEQQRRLGEPPGLATPFARSPRQRSLLPYLAAAIVIALGAGWFLTRDTAAPEKGAPATASSEAATANSKTAPTSATPAAATGGTAAAASGADPASASSASERRPTMGANAVANTNLVTTLAPPPRLNNQAPAQSNPPTVKEIAERESEPHPPGANPLAPGEAAPLTLGAAPPETPVNDPAGLASKMAVKEKERGADAAAPPTPESGRSPFIKERPSQPPTQAAKSPRPTTPAVSQTAVPPGGTAGLMPPETSAPTAAPPPPTPPVAAAAPSPEAPAVQPLEQLPVYWQLPYNVRKELPDLKMSMHVYSATPAQRFVVLNGNRQVEGDELGGDVRVSEIRKDGVVLIFQGQRFIVPRGGS